MGFCAFLYQRFTDATRAQQPSAQTTPSYVLLKGDPTVPQLWNSLLVDLEKGFLKATFIGIPSCIQSIVFCLLSSA